MTTRIIYPGKFLSEFVKYYWTLEGDGSNPYTERVFPTGDLQMLFHIKQPFVEYDGEGHSFTQPKSLICGQITSFRDVTALSSSEMIGVVFHPYALRYFSNLPAYELTDNLIHIGEISSSSYDFEKKLEECNDLQTRITLIEDYLTKQIISCDTMDMKAIKECLRRINFYRGNIKVSVLREQLGIGERKFERLFGLYVGIAPKQFIEIIKVNNAISMLKTADNLTSLAFTTGYYDQSHFNHAVKKYTGYSPSDIPTCINEK